MNRKKGFSVTGAIVTRWRDAESLHLLSWGFIKWKLPFVKLRIVSKTISLYLLLLSLITQEDWWVLGSQVIFSSLLFSSLVFHIFTHGALIRTASTYFWTAFLPSCSCCRSGRTRVDMTFLPSGTFSLIYEREKSNIRIGISNKASYKMNYRVRFVFYV